MVLYRRVPDPRACLRYVDWHELDLITSKDFDSVGIKATPGMPNLDGVSEFALGSCPKGPQRWLRHPYINDTLCQWSILEEWTMENFESDHGKVILAVRPFDYIGFEDEVNIPLIFHMREFWELWVRQQVQYILLN